MITKYFESELRQKTVPEVSDHLKLYSMWDDGGTEVEVGEFLYGMIRVLKPKNVLETGLYHGISASYMAQAIKDNGVGKLTSVEISVENIEISKRRLYSLDLRSRVQINNKHSLKYTPENSFQFIFLDTEPDMRFGEFVKFYPFLDYGGYLFIHDLHRHLSQQDNKELGFAWPFGKLPDDINGLIKDDKVRPFHFGTPRGMSGFYKVHPEDYKAI